MLRLPLPTSRLLKGLAAAVMAGFLAVAVPPAGPALAQSSIKVIVNDNAITSMDISSRAKLLQLANRLSPGAAQKAAVEELIDDSLRLNEAKRRGVTIKDEQVNEAIAEIAARSKLTPSQFAQALGQSGINIKSLRERIRAQMAWGRIIRARVQQNVRQEQTDLVAQMRRQEQSADTVTAEDYVLQRVVFTLPAKRTDSDIQRRRREAEALRGRFDGCEQGLPAARAMKEVAVLNIGRRLASEVPAQMREQVKETRKGQLTRPEVTDQGVEMLAVCDKITVTGESAMSASLDAEQMSAQGKTVSESMLRELRQRSNIIYR
ncbi:SurA N-terminal domain-containing protein [Mongoliimonas terrestris]|uniref:SurA N-terminal domain-containing protein n=1 Tax=Mongoliimonas terrestris TaxID=1709001 RepID=UPI000B08F89A|nr:SurA N-terminal domain-containing protein [Mongoliimonas terrestris]